ncbi:MAG: hypothetical protein HYS40_03640 [Gemmatimonadetes bacterium]|nr:hypothetical protein [Gemmatimonadota bacterium]
MLRPPAPDEGWERRFVADPARAQEAVELYTWAGFDVRVEPLDPEDLRDECESCGLAQAGLFRVIYTRRRK